MSVSINRNLQLYFGGQIVSMVGTWMQQMALSWLVYRITGSAFMLGVVVFASQAPSLVLTPIAGIVADRVNRHNLVIVTQVLLMVQAAALALMVFSGHDDLWALVGLSTVLGIISAFDMPARQTFLLDMLDSKDELPGAIGINSSIMTTTRMVGPTIAGLFVSWAGEGMCFLVNALSYLAVISALMFVRPRQNLIAVKTAHPFEQLRDGFAYAFGSPGICDLIVLLALIGLFGMPFAVLMPAFARDVFHGDSSTLGLLTAASGIGSLVGTICLTSWIARHDLGRWVIVGCGLFGAGLIAFGLSQSLLPALALLIVIGFGSMILMAGTNTLLQTLVDEDKRGRVMSIFVMAFMGLTPFGGIAAGAIAGIIGPGATVIASGLVTFALALIFASRIVAAGGPVTTVCVDRGIVDAEGELKSMNT